MVAHSCSALEMAARVASCRDECLQPHRLITRSLSRQNQQQCQQLVGSQRTRRTSTDTLLTGPTCIGSPARPAHHVSNRGKRADPSSPVPAGTPVRGTKRKRGNVDIPLEKPDGSGAPCHANDSRKVCARQSFDVLRGKEVGSLPMSNCKWPSQLC